MPTRTRTRRTSKPAFIPCFTKSVPEAKRVDAAKTAVDINPVNAPREGRISALIGEVMSPARIAALTTKFWGANGVKLAVAFLDNPAADLKAKILSHMNAWGKWGNVTFTEAAASSAQVRILRAADGYWSYLGTDILHIDKTAPTMNLEGFSMSTPDSEFYRVVRHETGHTLGFPHEHMRAAIVAKLDVAKTIEYFRRTQGWSETEVRQQVLTPISESSLLMPTPADITSIMCYQLPGSITIDGQPIPGGTDIDPMDGTYCGKIYPKADQPPPPPPPPGGFNLAAVFAALDTGTSDIITRNHVTDAQSRTPRGNASYLRGFEVLLKDWLSKAFPGKDVSGVVAGVMDDVARDLA